MKKIPLMKGIVGVKVTIIITIFAILFCIYFAKSQLSQSNSSLTLTTLLVFIILGFIYRISNTIKNIYHSISKRTYLKLHDGKLTIVDNRQIIYSGSLSELHEVDTDGSGISLHTSESDVYRLLRKHLENEEFDYFYSKN